MSQKQRGRRLGGRERRWRKSAATSNIWLVSGFLAKFAAFRAVAVDLRLVDDYAIEAGAT